MCVNSNTPYRSTVVALGVVSVRVTVGGSGARVGVCVTVGGAGVAVGGAGVSVGAGRQPTIRISATIRSKVALIISQSLR